MIAQLTQSCKSNAIIITFAHYRSGMIMCNYYDNIILYKMKKINGKKYSTKPFKGFKYKMSCGFNHNDGHHYVDIYTNETDRAEIRRVFGSMHFSNTWEIDLHITQFLTDEQLKYGAEVIGEVIDTCEEVKSYWEHLGN